MGRGGVLEHWKNAKGPMGRGRHRRGVGWDSGKVGAVKRHMKVPALPDGRRSGTGCSEDSEATSEGQREDQQMDNHIGRGQAVLGKAQWRRGRIG